MTKSAPHTIIFRITGDSMDKVIRWQQEMDLQIIRYQIKAKGGIMVLGSARTRELGDHLTEPPPLGDALPWYGEFGGGYTFEFQPHANGAHLKVVNEAGGHERFYPEPFPPLEIEIPTTIEIRAEPEENEEPLYTSDWGWWFNGWADKRGDGLIFVIDSNFCQRLVEWEWDSTRPFDYKYRFIPLSVGCEIFYHDIQRGYDYHLTNDVCW